MRLLQPSNVATFLTFSSALVLFAACTYQMPTIDPLLESESSGGAGGASSSAGGFGGTTASSSSDATSGSIASSSSSSSSGSEMLELCGDGILDPSEDCDDNNLTVGDGCDAMCNWEDHDGCGGPILELFQGTVVISGSTAGAVDDITRSAQVQNCGAGDRAGADMIYSIMPMTAGTLTATLKAEYNNHFLHIRNACPGEDFNEIACDYADSSLIVDMSTISVEANTLLYVIADGHLMDEGPFTLTLNLK